MWIRRVIHTWRKSKNFPGLRDPQGGKKWNGQEFQCTLVWVFRKFPESHPHPRPHTRGIGTKLCRHSDEWRDSLGGIVKGKVNWSPKFKN